MRFFTRIAAGVAGLALAVMASPVAASAADGAGLGLALTTAQSTFAVGDPVRLSLVVTNNSGSPCGLSKVAEGTVEIVSVRRDGTDLVPVLGRSFYLDGIGTALAAGLAQTQPGATVTVPVASVRVHEGDDPASVVLRSVAATPDGGGLDALWPVGAPGTYEVTASYAIPAVDGAVTPCLAATATKTVAFRVGDAADEFPWLWVIVGGATLLLVLVVVVFLARRRRPTAAAALVILLGLSGMVAINSRPAYADYGTGPSADPVAGVDFAKEVAGCMAKFEAPGGDPAGILPRLKDPKTPKVTIIPTNGGSNTFETSEGPDGKGSSVITWNPIDTQPFGDGVARDPCSGLYHELNHADDISRDKVPQGECGDTGIKTAEVKATFAENKYRKAKGLDPRTEYQGKKLPKNMDECKKQKKKEPPQKGPVKLCEGTVGQQCASTNGDPHLVTFDRHYYDFQAVGEFVVARSTAGDPLEIQSRQSPLSPSRTVSVNSAIAFRLSDQRVSLAIVDGATQVRVNGEVVAVPRGDKKLSGGGMLTARESDTSPADGYNVRWPDGSEAAVDQIGRYGYRLLVKLSVARAGKVEGLLGNFDGDPDNDVTASGGAPLAPPTTFAQLYPSYADSWRVTKDTSLFPYADGQSTETFTDRTFPDKPVTIADLDPARRAQAEQICRWAGVADSWAFLECVFDVGISGRSEFAAASSTTEVLAPPADAPILAKPIATGTLTAGTDGRITFAGHKGDAVFVDITAPTMRDACSPFRMLDPAGHVVQTGCNINGVGNIDRTVLTVDGEYSIQIEARDGLTGRAAMRVYLAKDTTGSIEPNGAAVSATVNEPGALARYQFTGVAGQRVFLDIPESTLPDQCSPLELRDSKNTVLATGCVIGGNGYIDGTVLPADGTYTVTIDPRGRAIGSVTAQLFAAKDQVASIAINGAPVAATIGQPGFVARYEFTSTAGQSVSVVASDATLPDQCSPLELRGPAGNVLASGCIINGTGGIDTVVLPTTGTYAVVVDPRDSGTGTVTIKLSAG